MVSTTNQIVQLQAEVTPGTPLTAAMKQYMGLKMMPAWAVNGDSKFRASGFKVPTAYIPGAVTGAWSVDGIQCYNALGVAAKSVLGPPVPSTPVGATTAKQYVFTPAANAPDTIASFTAQYGQAGAKAIQAAFLVFQSLGIAIEYGNLTFSAAAISKNPDETATLVTSGVTQVPAVPINPMGYDVFVDNTWGTLGTTKALACYHMEIANPDKYDTDSPIDSTVNGFKSLVEKSDMDYAITAQFGFDTAGVSLVTDWKAGQMKFIRVKVTGPIIETTIHYSLQWDFAVRLTGVGEITTAPGSSTAVLPFTGSLEFDPTSGFFQQLTLVNTVTAY